MIESAYWLGFSVFSGVGPKKFELLRETFVSAEAAWYAAEDLLQNVLGPTLTRKFLRFRQEFSLQQYIEDLDKANVWFVTLLDEDYPALLRKSHNPPFLVYGRGKRDLLLESKPIGIVGTRKITSYGRQVTASLTRELSLAGCTIVSGLAMGVDALAHATALENKGKTIAVLGCGVDCCNPGMNQQLYDFIVMKGCVLSEFPLHAEPTNGSFPSRNRIIAGLSHGVIVTEGAADSGALITAEFALKDKRKVFAVPGPITSNLSYGPNSLLAKGATLITSGSDVLRSLGESQRVISSLTIPTGETQEEQSVINLLHHEQLTFDQLIQKTTFGTAQLNMLLSLMEMKQLVELTQEGKYQLVVL